MNAAADFDAVLLVAQVPACELCDAKPNKPCEPHCPNAVGTLGDDEEWPAEFIPFPTADTLEP